MAMSKATTQTTDIIKEGYLAPGLDRRPSLFKTKSKLWCQLLIKRDQTTILDCYKDDTKTKLKHRFSLTQNEIKFGHTEHGNYFYVQLGEQITYLHAENRQQRDDWYRAITALLDPQGTSQDGAIRRDRFSSEAASSRPPIKRERPIGTTQTTDSALTTFKKEINKPSSRRPLPTIPGSPHSNENHADYDWDVAKVRDEPYCCVRVHVVLDSATGTGTARWEKGYENVHYIESQQKWIVEVEKRRETLGQNSQTYSDLNSIMYMQRGNDNTYDTVIRRTPVEHDERELIRSAPATRRGEMNQEDSLLSETSARAAEAVKSRRRCTESNKVTETEAEEVYINLPKPRRRLSPPIPPKAAPNAQKRVLSNKIATTRAEQSQVHGIPKTFQKTSLVGGKIRLMEMKDGIWIIALNKSEWQLRNALKIGDQLIKTNQQALSSVNYARETINNTDDNVVTLVIKRIPHGTICTVTRKNPNDDIGIKVEGNEIVYVDPYGILASHGGLKPQATGLTGLMCNWAITEINTQAVDLSASTDDVVKLLRMAKENVALIVHPVDFIQGMRDNLA